MSDGGATYGDASHGPANHGAANHAAAGQKLAAGMTDTKYGLLAKAAATGDPAPEVGDLANFFRAYYRHVEVDDLGSAGADRVAAAALAQARMAVDRPQGRALVEVRPGGAAALDASSDVIDIVTDDMPFLVDSITMELATTACQPGWSCTRSSASGATSPACSAR